jgi:hypothetical protein
MSTAKFYLMVSHVDNKTHVFSVGMSKHMKSGYVSFLSRMSHLTGKRQKNKCNRRMSKESDSINVKHKIRVKIR